MVSVMTPTPAGQEVISWVDASGTEHVFDPAGTIAPLPGASNRWGMRANLTAQAVPFGHGDRVRSIRATSRSIPLPLGLFGATLVEKEALAASVTRWFDTLGGPGYLRRLAPSGSLREILAYCEEVDHGAEQTFETDGITWRKVGVGLRCPEPWWEDVVAATATYTLAAGSPAVLFKTPFFPIYLPSSAVVSRAVLYNDGDFEAYPVWTVTGPGSDLALRNLTSGAVLSLSGQTFAAGAVVTIDTRPGSAGVTDLGGARYAVAPASELWALPQGVSTIQVEMGNATAATSIGLEYRRRWWSP